MVCTKEDVVQWFKELESYKRIDTMCTLLNMCLPFELRFLGTCLEELGRRDSQELRGIELRVNNAIELAADVASCRQGEPTDLKIRRKMALYLALIRSCSRSCVVELFHTLDGWGDRDFLRFGETPNTEHSATLGTTVNSSTVNAAASATAVPSESSSAASEPLQELLLVYTMAANHPVFSFEQRMKCGQIYTKISDCNRILLRGNCSTGASDLTRPPSNMSSGSSSNVAATPPPAPITDINQGQHKQHLIQMQMQPLTHLQQQQLHHQHGMMPQIPIGFAATAPGAQIITTTSDPNAITIEGITHIMPHSLSLQQQQPQSDFIVGTNSVINHMQQPPTWPIRHALMHASYPPPSHEPISLPAITASMSPLSEPSSPVQSRTASPSRHQQQQHSHQSPHSLSTHPQHHHQQTAQQHHQHQHSLQLQQRSNTGSQSQHNPKQQRASLNVGPNRRASDDRTSPPHHVPQQQQQHHAMLSGHDATGTKSYDEMVLNVDGAINQLQSIHRNGYTRSTLHHTLPRLNKHSTYLQQQHHHFHMQNHLQQQQHIQQLQQKQTHQTGQFATTTGNCATSGVYTSLQKSQQHQQLMEGTHFSEQSADLQHKSNESDSSSVSDSSPPDTPTLFASGGSHHQQANMNNLHNLHNTQSTASNASRHHQSSGKDCGNSAAKHYPRHNGRSITTTSTTSPTTTLDKMNVGASQILYLANTPYTVVQQSGDGLMSAPPPSVGQPQLISTSNAVGVNSVITTNPTIMHLHPYPTHNPGNYPQYVQSPHLMTTSRGAILSQPPPSQQQSHFRTAPPPTFMQTTNGDIMYTQYPPHQQQSQPPPSLPYHLTPAGSSIIAPNVRLSPSIQQQVSPLPSSAHQSSNLGIDPSIAAASPLNPKQVLSCFNCGSQSHIGRDCHEASMEDVTRNSVYKLDYTAAQALTELQNAAAAAVASASASSSSPSSTSSSSSTTSSTASVNTSTSSSADGPELVPEVSTLTMTPSTDLAIRSGHIK